MNYFLWYCVVAYLWTFLDICVSVRIGKFPQEQKHIAVLMLILSPLFFPLLVVVTTIKLLYAILGFSL